ncbi:MULTISPECIES: Na(+)/H(+) antiporter subunit B [Sulfurimonas]|uniref:Na(+)/H(+) antiporter subunit B n=1 Tax=Sulfurimonas TaxID=202746 RepID=UPI00125F2D08|nr:hydrogenase subunit MbhD domain-containing protein [Sulfurimonas hydrogeniphila]
METLAIVEFVFDMLLSSSLLFVAYKTLTCKDLFQAIVFFIVFGLLISVAWGRLGAYDVAMAEVVIGAGLTGALLLSALVKLKKMNID